MPPVRDLQSTQDPRAIALATGNLSTDRWTGARPGERQITNPIPRALRAKGYEPVAALISAWIGDRIDVGTVRSWWRFDLAGGQSHYLPPPDAIIKRKGGTLLPGWADETIREWLSRDHPAFKKGMINMETYLAWDAENDEVDPLVVAFLAGNQERDIQAIEHPGRADHVPLEYLTLGYAPAAQVIASVQGKALTDNTVCTYWREDILRTDPQDWNPRRQAHYAARGDLTSDPYSLRMPVPEAIIARGPRGDLMPGWTEHTLQAWVPTRPGPGNRTRGEGRRGTRLTGPRKVGDKSTPAADLLPA